MVWFADNAQGLGFVATNMAADGQTSCHKYPFIISTIMAGN